MPCNAVYEITSMEGSHTGKYRQGVATEGKLCLSNYVYITSSCFTS